MPTRRAFCQTVAGAAALSVLPESAVAERAVTNSLAEPADQSPPAPYREDKPLLELQRAFLERRLGMFVHFNLATFQDREWGDPSGAIEAFHPTALDTDGWAAAAVSAKMQYACLTTKHHDGFPIWPTRTAVKSVRDLPGNLDVVRAYVDSFRKAGLSVGLYFSILDLRNDIRHFNVTPEKIALIEAQLTELLTDYGPIDLLIFDGWDAPWSRIPYDEVPFARIYALVKRLQPNCLISELNASQYPPSALYYSDIKAFEQNAGQHIPSASDIPAQSCVTLTDGWFWKTGDEDRPLKTAQQVVDEWLLPQNAIRCNLIVNAAPNREGRFAPNIVARLREIGERFDAAAHSLPASPVGPSAVITTMNLATGRPIRASASPDTVGPDLINDGKFATTWHLPEESREGWIEIELGGVAFNRLTLIEPIGRWEDYATTRIGTYRFETSDDGQPWRTIARGTGGAAVTIHDVDRHAAKRLRLTFEAIAPGPHLADIGVYDEPGPA